MKTRRTIVATGSKCRICGAPAEISGKPCSSGCALAARLPMGDGPLPISWQLVAILVAFVVLVNQGLLASVWWIRAGRGLFEAVEAEGFRTASIVAGWIWVGFAAAASAAAGVWRLADRVVLVAAFVAGAAPWYAPFAIEQPVWSFFVANLLMAIWLHRGLWLLWQRQN